MKVGDELTAGLREFLTRHGLRAGASLTPLGGGGRHRVYAVGEERPEAALKIYEAPSHGRDAYARETAVHDVLAPHVPCGVPAVLGRDPGLRCALFAWVEGCKVGPEAIDAVAVEQMARFIAAINAPDVREAARGMGLPPASDAAFSLAGHRRVARARIEALRGVPVDADLGAQLEDLLEHSLLPALERLERPTAIDEELREAERILSPSDFGFHNVIVRPDGGFSFIDFEHAGWDDPAKMAADFILQPECRLDPEAAHVFIDELERSEVVSRAWRQRVQALLPVQAVKWAAIMLNVFQRPGQPREMLAARLDKARHYLRETGAGFASLARPS